MSLKRNEENLVEKPVSFRERKRVCENSRFEVYYDHLEGGGGYSVPNYLVVSPKRKTEDLVSGVAILPVVEEKVALLKIYRHPIESWSWEIPRGFIEDDEDNYISVSRELEEETGLCCDRSDIKSLGLMAPDAGILAARIHLFVALRCRVVREFVPNEIGHSELKWVNAGSVARMIQDGIIQDPSTLVALYKYWGNQIASKNSFDE